MTTATAPQVLSETQARAMRQAEKRVGDAEDELDAALEQRKLLREKYKPLVPLVAKDADPDGHKKGVREITILGGKVRIAPSRSGETFSIAKYRAAGGRVTAKMKPFVGGKVAYDRWTVDLPS